MERPSEYCVSTWRRVREKGQDWRAYLRQVEGAVTLPAFKEDIQAQAWVIAYLREFAGLGGDSLAPLATLVMETLGLTEDRFRFLLSLTRLRDLRAALKARYVEPGPRREAESVYPTDGWIGSYLRYVQETPTPLAFHFWAAVALLGAAARRNVYMHMGSYFLYPNQYLVLVGERALGKSLAIAGQSCGRVILEEANGFLDEMLLEQVRTGDHVYFDPQGGIEDLSVRIMPDKITPQRLLEVLATGAKNRRLIGAEENPLILTPQQSVAWLGNDELSNLVGHRVYGSDQMIHLLTGLYNCPDRWSAGTITRGTDDLHDTALTFVGGSTIEWINKAMTPDMFEGGFMSRVVYVHRPDTSDVRRYELFEPPLDPLQRHALAQSLVPFMLLPEMEAELTEDAKPIFVDFKKETESLVQAPDHPRLGDYYARRNNHFAKLAMALSLSDCLNRFGWEMTSRDIEGLGSLPIRRTHLEQAREILTYEETFIPMCFQRIGEHEDQKMVDYLVSTVRSHNARHQEGIRMGQLADRMRRVAGNKWKKHLEAALESSLVERHLFKPKSGRPTDVFWASGGKNGGTEDDSKPV